MGYICQVEKGGICVPAYCDKNEDCADPAQPRQKFECVKMAGTTPVCVPVNKADCTGDVRNNSGPLCPCTCMYMYKYKLMLL